MRVVLLGLVPLTLAACGPGTTAGTGGLDGGDDPDAGSSAAADVFDTERIVVEVADPLTTSGLGIAMRGDGRWAVAYAAAGEGTFQCETLTGGTIEGGDNVDIVVVDEQLDGAHRRRVVATVPGVKPGSIDLAIDPVTDALVVAFPGGTPANGYCGASDLAVAVESGDAFTVSIVATDSATGGQCRYIEDPFCEIGDTVGLFPSVAVDDDGTIAISYQDLHNGFADKDLYGSDLELARGASAAGLGLATISAEVGGGYNGSIAFGPDGRVVVGHAILASNQFQDADGVGYEIAKGIYVAVEQADGTFIETPLVTGIDTDGRVAVAHDPQAGFVAAYHAKTADDLVVATSRDDGATWTLDPVDQLGRTGRDPALGFLSDGVLVVAYGFCGTGTGDGCARSGDGVVVATKTASGWKKQHLEGDDEDQEGKDVDMAVRGDDVAIASLDTSQAQLVVHVLARRP